MTNGPPPLRAAGQLRQEGGLNRARNLGKGNGILAVDTCAGRTLVRQPHRRLPSQKTDARSPLRETSGDKDSIATLHTGIAPDIRGRPELGDFTSTQWRESARILSRYGRDSAGSVKNNKATKRDHFRPGARREVGRRPLSPIYDMSPHPPPKRGRSLGEVEFADVSIPLALASYRDPLSIVGSILRASQDIANDVSEAMAKADSPRRTSRISRPITRFAHCFPVWLSILTSWASGKHAPRECRGDRNIRPKCGFVATCDLFPHRTYVAREVLSGAFRPIGPRKVPALDRSDWGFPSHNALSRGVSPICLGGREGAYRA